MSVRKHRIYLDVSWLNRPFDDSRQDRIRLEAAAISIILEQSDDGKIILLASQVSEMEIASTHDAERRRRVYALLPPHKDRIRLSDDIFTRGDEIESLGVKPADALHLAAAEASRAGVFLTCDDRLSRTVARHPGRILMSVRNPVQWLAEQHHAPNA